MKCFTIELAPVLVEARGVRALHTLAGFYEGFPFSAEELDITRLDELAGVEVYKRGVTVPWEFRRGLDGGCGAIVM